MGRGCHLGVKRPANGLTGANSWERGQEALSDLSLAYYVSILGPQPPYCSWRSPMFSGLGWGTERLVLEGRSTAPMLSMYSRVWAGTYF